MRSDTPQDDLPEHVSTYGVMPWERQAREPDDAWALFVAYRDSGYPDGVAGPFRARKVSELAATHDVAYGTLKRLSGEHNWVERAGAFDRELDRRKSESGMSLLDRQRARDNRMVDKMYYFGEVALDTLIARFESGTEDPTNNEIRQWLGDAIKLKRLINGQSTEIVEVQCRYDLSRLTLEEMETFRALEARMRLPEPANVLAPDLTTE